MTENLKMDIFWKVAIKVHNVLEISQLKQSVCQRQHYPGYSYIVWPIMTHFHYCIIQDISAQNP